MAASARFADETRLQTSNGPPFGEYIPWEGVTRVGAARIGVVAYAERFYARRHQDWSGMGGTTPVTRFYSSTARCGQRLRA